MNAVRILVVTLVLTAGSAAGLYWHAHSTDTALAAPADGGGAEPAPVARVQVAPLKVETVQETLTALGTVEAAPGETQTFSVPYESRVVGVLVAGGQSVDAGQDLIEVEPSPDATLQIEQARQERAAAQNQLDVVKQREGMKLATRQEVLQARQALQAADLRVQSLERRGIDGRRTLAAAGAGIVSRIDVQPGQIVPAGGPLVETIGEGRISVRLGVESVDAGRLKAGMQVSIQPVNDPQAAFGGKVRRIGRAVDPQTRLVSVLVTPDAGAHLLLNQYVRGTISVASRRGLVAPPPAVLPEGDASVLYTVRDGRAVRHEVKVGLQNGRHVELKAPGLQAGQMAVVEGNSELEDGMAVDAGPAQ